MEEKERLEKENATLRNEYELLRHEASVLKKQHDTLFEVLAKTFNKKEAN